MEKLFLIKFLLTVTILIIITVAIITVGFGQYLLKRLSLATCLVKSAKLNKTSEFLDTINEVSVGTIFVGSFIVFMGLVGLCGVIRENKQCLWIYTVFLIILCAVEIKFITLIQEKIGDLLETAESMTASFWEGIFNEFKHQCNQRYYQNSELLQEGSHDVIATSFCNFVSSEYPEKIYDMLPTILRYYESDQKVKDYWNSKTRLMRYIGYSLAFIEVMSFTLAINLLNIL